MDLKNISKLLAFSLVASGCISREPVVKYYEYEVKENDGTVRKQKAGYVTNEPQFTLLGNVWNAATFGVVGTGYVAYSNCLEGAISTNNVPVIGSIANGAWGLVSGAAEGLYKGTIYGATMKYGEAQTLDDFVADQVQRKASMMRDWANRYIGE